MPWSGSPAPVRPDGYVLNRRRAHKGSRPSAGHPASCRAGSAGIPAARPTSSAARQWTGKFHSLSAAAVRALFRRYSAAAGPAAAPAMQATDGSRGNTRPQWALPFNETCVTSVCSPCPLRTAHKQKAPAARNAAEAMQNCNYSSLSRSRNSASVSTGTPNACALVSLEPAAVPATT